MCHTSPASFLVWSTFATGLLGFLLYHLWAFDRFQCVKWNNGPYSGAFKRIMTYSYLLSVPLSWIFTIGFAIIKYNNGFIVIPGLGVFPKPYTAWDPVSKAAVFPLMFLFAFGWALEVVTHLEELCFWYFLLNVGNTTRDWFRTWHFRFWVLGSTSAVISLPLLAIFTRADPLKSEAYIFTTGSLGSLTITICFLPILWMFPTFLDSLREQGVDMATVARLTKFNEINVSDRYTDCVARTESQKRARVFLRFLFTVPLLTLGIDGLRPVPVINENMAISDILVTIAGFGCSLSSAMTLVIFFPRSIEKEISERDAVSGRKFPPSRNATQNETHEWDQGPISDDSYVEPVYAHDGGSSYPFTTPPMKANFDNDTYQIPEDIEKLYYSRHPTAHELPPLRPNRKKGAEVGSGDVNTSPRNDASRNTSRSQSRTRYSVNPMIQNWRSPLGELAYLMFDVGSSYSSTI
ncbi:hypothetical protein M378DRAFT_70798 [Amanita muscaria Koide BX008]|uniref:Uncharacterized protein n=1 Tax=Amanita muscaria (strain Koide BX008) TaxID=946122 RepID=A0A0C2TNG3_AMAMK|nr:hypothetical protein M378DRAFT_70798 [Amanita muscaria Koide BX008]